MEGDNADTVNFDQWVKDLFNDVGFNFQTATLRTQLQRPRTVLLSHGELPKSKIKKPCALAPACAPRPAPTVARSLPKPSASSGTKTKITTKVYRPAPHTGCPKTKTAPKPNVVLPRLLPKPTATTTPKAKTKFIKKINNLNRVKAGIEKPKVQPTHYTKPDVSLIYRTTGYISTPWAQRERN